MKKVVTQFWRTLLNHSKRLLRNSRQLKMMMEEEVIFINDFVGEEEEEEEDLDSALIENL